MRNRLHDVALGTVTAAVVFGAVPAVLIAFVGVPLPARWDRPDIVAAHGLFDALAVVAWISWAACALPLLRSVVAHVRRGDTTPPAGARLAERLAIRIAAAVLALSPLGGALASAAGAATPPSRPSPPLAVPWPRTGAGGAARTGDALAPLPSSSPAPAAPPAALPAGGRTIPATGGSAVAYTVTSGDSLWSIAVRAYGHGADWPAIAGANLGRLMPDGSRFLDPSLIRPGWVLELPAVDGTAPTPPSPLAHPVATSVTQPVATSAAEPAASPVAASAAEPAAGPTPGSVPRRTAGASAVARATAGPSRRPASAPPDGRPPGGRTSGETSADLSPPGAVPPAPTPRPLPLPALTALGFGALTAGLVARRARQARRLRALFRPEGGTEAWLADGLADELADGLAEDQSGSVDDEVAALGTAIAGFDDLPLLGWVELADRHLGATVGIGAPFDAGVEAMRAGPDGVEVRLREPPSSEPPGWERVGPRCWRLPAAADPRALEAETAAHGPLLPLLAPIGEDGRGTWLLPFLPGSRTSVLGPEAEALVAAMALAAASWSWRDDVVVTTDPGAATAAGHGAGRTGGRPVLFVGDPDHLPPQAALRCASLTTRPLPDAETVVVVDRRAAAVHPLGLTLRPHLLQAPVAAAAEGLLAAPPARPVPPPPVGPSGAPPQPARRCRPTLAVVEGAGPEGPVAGPVEVRLLVAVPRLDGLAAELPANRARRAVELVAYLALHRPEPVTGDRLRTRVLGSEDADAAAKTLFNTVGAARRALGLGADGLPLLPPATRTGHYRLAGTVTTDVDRAAALVRAGLATDDPGRAARLLHAALALIEDEPLSGVLSGYGWWRAEGHERRIADLVVDAACHLARSAAERGDVDLARWSVERARLVEPYSEALARTAMQVAAAAGDAGRLHREWLDCVRMVDEVDPGSFPSEETEQLYGALRRRVPAGAGGGADAAGWH